MARVHHITLHWNHHQKALVEMFDKVLSNERLVDCTLAAEGQYIKAHKLLLSACSPYFELLLSQHYDKHPIIILNNVTFRQLKVLVDYMYRGKVDVFQDELDALVKVAENLQIRGLSDSGGNGTEPKEKPPDKRKLPLPHSPSTQQPSPIISPSGLTIEPQRSNQLDHSQGSMNALDGSLVTRKRRRKRRRSSDDGSGLGHTLIKSHHHSSSRKSSSLSIPPNVALTPVSKCVAVILDQPPVQYHTDHHILPQPGLPTHLDIVHKKKPNTEMLLEPIHEYSDEDMNEDSVEDLTPELLLEPIQEYSDEDMNEDSVEDLTPELLLEPIQEYSDEDMNEDSVEGLTPELLLEPIQEYSDEDMNEDSVEGLTPELLLEPKQGYLDEDMNKNSVEGLTPEDDVNDLEQSQAGPSGEGSRRKGFNPCMASDRSTNEVFMDTQQAVGAQRDSQEILRPEKTNSDSKVALGISSQQMLILKNFNLEHNAPLINECRIHLRRCDENVVAGSTSVKGPTMMSKPTSHLNTSNGDDQTETVFQCEHCAKSFRMKKHLRRHLKYCSCKLELVECDQCSEQFNNKSSLIHHLQNMCGKQKYICGYCKRQFKFEKFLHLHMKLECSKINAYRCPKRLKQCLSKKNLNCNLKDECSSTKPHQCPQCQREFFKKRSFYMHQKYSCGKNELFSCPSCDKQFKWKISLNAHMKHDCGRTEPHKCPQCQKLYSKKKTLYEHLRNSCGKKKTFSCPSCSKEFKYKSNLTKHMKHSCGRANPHVP